MQLREKLPEIESHGARLACVVQGTAEEAARFCGRHGLAECAIPDPEKESFRAMGLGRCKVTDLLLPSDELKMRRAEAAALGCGISLRGTFQAHSDILQLPGAALVARGGRILWLHRGAHPADLPLPAQLAEVVRAHRPD